MSMSNSQEVLTSTSGAKKKPRTDSYSAATLRRNDDKLSRPYHPGYCSATVKQRNPYRSGDDGHHLLRLRLDLCAGADPRRDVFRPLWQQSDLCPVNFLLVAVYPAAKFHPRPKIPAASAPGLGVSEAPCFPANSRIVSTWFPQHERARATATYTVGEYIGLAAFSPLLFLILEHHGWRTLFSSPAD